MLEVGQIIDGKYRVERLLGKGGMGAVYEGYHTLVERRVAIKVLLAEMTASGEGVARFEREVRATGRIGNEHLLEVFDVGRLPDGSRYMVSEYLDGETLSGRLEKSGALTARETAKITLELLDGLAAAHEAGVVHRDLKPDNIFLLRRKGSQSDFVKIIDFGVSKFQTDDKTNMSMTATGAVLGTPYYLSPEQARGMRDIDARSDLYTVGVIMYQAVAGHVPIHAETFNELLFKIALQDAPRLKSELPELDPHFDALVTRAMARERSARFANAREMHAALSAWLAASTTVGPASTSSSPSAVHATAVPPLPTSSNFGRTSAVSALEKQHRSRPGPLLFGLIGLGVLIAGGAAAFAFHVSGSKPQATASVAVSSVPLPPAVPETAAPVVAPAPDTAQAPPSVRAEPTVATAHTADEANAAPPAKPIRALAKGSSRRPPAVSPTPAAPAPTVAVIPVPPPATTAPPPAAPKPAAPARRERDFGY